MANNEETEVKRVAEESTETFNEGQLTDEQRRDFVFVKERIGQLQETRKNHYGHNLDTLWEDADKDYIPHRLKTTGTRVIATDEDKGWRGTVVTLGSSNWQSDVSQSNPFIKVQIALSILIDQHPVGVFTPMLKKYQASTELMRQLYERSWKMARSLPQLKLFVFNLAKYGWAVARTYPLRVERTVKVLVDYDEENPENSTYEEKVVVEYNDVFRENLDVRNTWMDDMARPNAPLSVRDWAWRKVYDYDDAKSQFGKYKRFQYVQAGGNVAETIRSHGVMKEYKGKKLVEAYFYENRTKDLFFVILNGVPVVIEPLPIADDHGVKKLSLWQTYWNLRHAESSYGVGIYEAMRYNQALMDRVRNMTIDQLTLSIYKMFFYQGTQNLQETGEITIKPGVGKQVIDPKSINWLDVPGPGEEAWKAIEVIGKDIDEDSGITDPLLGLVTGKTAFEIAQAKESALKRLKNPFENILEALNEEAYITLSVMQLIYSIPETYEIGDPELIAKYLLEIESDEDLYEREEMMDEEGNETTKFTAKVYPEFPLNLDKDEQNNLIETKETKFFRVKPGFLHWDGIINVKSQSILTPSKQVDKALDLEFYNMYIPLLSSLAQEWAVASQVGIGATLDDLPHGKVAKSLAKLYDKDPKDVLPDIWIEERSEDITETKVGGEDQPPEEGEESLFVQSNQEQDEQAGAESLFVPPNTEAGATTAPKAVAQTTVPQQPRGFVQRAVSRLVRPFRQ